MFRFSLAISSPRQLVLVGIASAHQVWGLSERKVTPPQPYNILFTLFLSSSTFKKSYHSVILVVQETKCDSCWFGRRRRHFTIAGIPRFHLLALWGKASHFRPASCRLLSPLGHLAQMTFSNLLCWSGAAVSMRHSQPFLVTAGASDVQECAVFARLRFKMFTFLFCREA